MPFLLHLTLNSFSGSAVAQALAYFILFVCTFAYVLISGCYKETWGGTSIAFIF